MTRKEVNKYSVDIIYKSELTYIVVTTNEDNVNITQMLFHQASTLSMVFFFPSYVIMSCVSFLQEYTQMTRDTERTRHVRVVPPKQSTTTVCLGKEQERASSGGGCVGGGLPFVRWKVNNK